MKTKPASYTITPYPRIRLLMADGGQLGRQKHTIHGLVEFDVTLAREYLRRQRAETGQARSFSAFFLACLGQAIDQERSMHAYRDWRNRLVIFDEVDVNMLFEVEERGRKIIRPHILRAINRKSFEQINAEIQAFKHQHRASQEAQFIDRFVRLPGFIRRLFLRALFKNPQRIKDLYGTVLVSSIGMFGTGSGWGLPVPNHTLQLTLGGIAEKPGVLDGQIAIRQMMSVTISIDHDLIDGAPAARFVQRLRELVESAAGLPVELSPAAEGAQS